MTEEIFKDVKDFEGLYQVSNWGNVMSLNYHRSGRAKLMKPRKNKVGYLIVGLWKNGEYKTCKVHRLVAQTFLPNPDNLPQVNHKDEDKTNNRVENLEWCSSEYNINYGTRNERISKKVLQFTLDGEFVREYPSTAECERNGFNHGNVVACCKGKLKKHKGFLWQYK